MQFNFNLIIVVICYINCITITHFYTYFAHILYIICKTTGTSKKTSATGFTFITDDQLGFVSEQQIIANTLPRPNLSQFTPVNVICRHHRSA